MPKRSACLLSGQDLNFVPGHLTWGFVFSLPLSCPAGDLGVTARFDLQELTCNSGQSSEPWKWEALVSPEPISS